ncbi:unnamed protein product [Caenorhabditis auriculariae]|uniref:Peptidase M28 domain-containing protein n=1 Tax=Caenorhabditis auriculariae TaxID=2777116 RepID=A0A8S1HDF6_9PELO|nr:unnamed protein product [Caenorhabditis auriculariae]
MRFSTVAFLLASTALLVSGSAIREKRQCGCAQQQSTCSCSQPVYAATTAAPQMSCSCQQAPVQQTSSCGCAQQQTYQVQVQSAQCAPACQQSCQQSCQAAPSVPQCQQTCQQSCMPSCAPATTPAPQIIQLQLDISAEASCQPACQQQCQQSCQAAPSVPQCQQSCQAACVPSCAPTTTPAPQVIQVQLDISAQATCQPACQQQCQQQCVQQQQPVAQCNSQCNNQCQSMCAPATTPAPSCQPACQPACQPQCTQQQQPQEIQIVLQTSVAQSPQCEPQCQQQCQQQCVQQQQPASQCAPACASSCSNSCSSYQPAQVACQPTPSSSCGCQQNYSPCGNGQCCRRNTFRRLLGIRTSSSKMRFSTVAFLLASTALLVSGSVIREKRQCGCAQQQSTCSCSQQVYTMTTAAPQRSCFCQSAPVQQTPSCGCAQPQTLQIQVPVSQCAPACQQSCQQSCQAAPSVPQCQQTCQQSCMPSCAPATTPAPQIIQLQLDISAEASCQPACQQQCQQSCQAAPSVPQCQQSCQAACVPSCAPTTTPAPQVIQVQLDISAQATCQPACQQQCQQQCVQQQQPVAQCNSQCNNQCQSMCAPATTPAPSCQPACQPACQPQCTQQQQPQEIQIVLQTSVAQSPQCEPQCQQQCQQQCVQQQQPASQCAPACASSCSNSCSSYQPAQVACQPTPSSSCGCQQNYSPCGNGQCCHVHTIEYEVLLSYPDFEKPNTLEIKAGNGKTIHKSSGRTPVVVPDEQNEGAGIQWAAYSANGTVTADVVYCNYGSRNDFRLLREIGLDVKGKIAMIRFGHDNRGQKVKNAEEFEAVGVLLYADPQEVAKDGTDAANVYPNKAWMPPTEVQRGAVTLQNGDILTPHYPAKIELYRPMDLDKAFKNHILPGIPVLPITYSTAKAIFKVLGGDIAPVFWKGALEEVEYRYGPNKNGTKITMTVNSKLQTRKIQNVIGYIHGAKYPDEYVILGNHYDAWAYGSVDPISGTAVLTEIARAFTETMNETDWRSARTLMFTAWDAEEFGHIGSVEFVEEFVNILQERAVVRIQTSPPLYQVTAEVAKKVADPNQKMIGGKKTTLFDSISLGASEPVTPDESAIKNVEPVSEHSAFLHFAGIPVVDIRPIDHPEPGAEFYPLHHTITFADEPILPYSVTALAYSLLKVHFPKMRKGLEELDVHPRLLPVDGQITKFGSTVERFLNVSETFEKNFKKDVDSKMSGRLNSRLKSVERCFIKPEGFSEIQTSRHVLYRRSRADEYSGRQLGGVFDAMKQYKESSTDENAGKIAEEVSAVQYCVMCAMTHLQDFI